MSERPLPDEAPLEERPSRFCDRRLRDLSVRDWKSIFVDSVKRILALEMTAAIGVAFLLVAVLVIFGPALETLVASHAGGAAGAVGWIWWVAEWPILLVGLVAAFSTLLYLGPDVKQRRWAFIT